MTKALDEAGFARADVVLWNVVPQCISTADRNANASMAQIRAAAPDTQAFIDRLPNLAVAVFCGRSAQRAIPLLRLPPHVQVLSTFHPGARSYNRLECRNHVHETFRRARMLLSGAL